MIRETNLDEVLQIQCVFTNVSKGQFANKKDMFQVFCTEDETQIVKTILEQGELHLTEKERSVEQQSLFRDVAKIVSERCVNPETNRAYTVTMIEKMMKDCHISLKANKTAKQHALEVVKQLRSTDGFKIAPSMMEVVISIDSTVVDQIKDRLVQLCKDVLRQGLANVVVVEPQNYGAIEALLHSEIKGKYCIEIAGNTKHGPLHTVKESSAVCAPDTVHPSEKASCTSSKLSSGDQSDVVNKHGTIKDNSKADADSLLECPMTGKLSAPSSKKSGSQGTGRAGKTAARRRKQGRRKNRDDSWSNDEQQ
ncbi:ribosome maturation protein SDO1 [Paragonimus westermani]|uniref:Ribosome maturation protein SDO1 n=1 Tax=Paragonimus westermani TaxID=34504 RepID=A0A5J4P178_9TREM|nr:ribosome maturation protein SDO1 [Paragonimus westermani]